MTSSTVIFFAKAAIGLSIVCPAEASEAYGTAGWMPMATLLVAIVASTATNVAGQWKRIVVLRLGRFQALRRPGHAGSPGEVLLVGRRGIAATRCGDCEAQNQKRMMTHRSLLSGCALRDLD